MALCNYGQPITKNYTAGAGYIKNELTRLDNIDPVDMNIELAKDKKLDFPSC